MSLPRERPFFPPQLSVRVWRKWDSERAADRCHLKSACCWLDRDKPGKTQNLRCSAARKPRSSLWGADGNIVRCWLAARYSQQCIQIKCFSKDCKPFLSYRRKKKKIGVPSDHRRLDNTNAAKHLFHFGNELPCHPNISHSACTSAASCIEKNMRQRKVGDEQFHSVEGHVLRGRKHMPLFCLSVNPFFLLWAGG